MAALATSIRILVVGAGAMGSGIAHVAARAGHMVYLYDQHAEAVAKGKAGIEKDLRFLVGKGKDGAPLKKSLDAAHGGYDRGFRRTGDAEDDGEREVNDPHAPAGLG